MRSAGQFHQNTRGNRSLVAWSNQNADGIVPEDSRNYHAEPHGGGHQTTEIVVGAIVRSSALDSPRIQPNASSAEPSRALREQSGNSSGLDRTAALRTKVWEHSPCRTSQEAR